MKASTVRWWMVSLATAILFLVVPLPEKLVERFYSRNAYLWIQPVITSISNVVPLAVTDILLFGAIGWALWTLVRIVRGGRKQGWLAALWDAFRRFVRLASILIVLFFCFWGFNYRRVPLEATLHGAASSRPTADDLKLAISDANALAGRLRGTPSSSSLEFDALAKQLSQPFGSALQQLGRPQLGRQGRPKYSLFLTPFFTAAGVDGMIDPLALETIVHPDLLPFERPFILAHEWAHLAGQADEAEASAIGWLACMQGEPPLAYSASVYLIIEAGSALPSNDWQATMARLDPGVISDIRSIEARLQHQRPAVRASATRVYDSYLRANRVDDGVRSYSRALSLILASPLRDALSGYRIR